MITRIAVVTAAKYEQCRALPVSMAVRKSPVCGRVEVAAGGQLKVPIPRSSCHPGG